MSGLDATPQQDEQLARVRALSAEIASAISAIGRNDMGQFQIHVANQEALCNRMTPLQAPLIARQPVRHRADLDPVDNFRTVHLELLRLNRIYAAVIMRAAKTNKIIAALYRCSHEGYEQAHSETRSRHTWSCEV